MSLGRDEGRGAAVMTEKYSYSVILEPQAEGGFTVLVPALPEVVTEGDTETEALQNAEEAIRAVLEYRRDNGIAIPTDAQPEIRRVTVAA
jgi:antitoxin HicB